MGGVLSGLNPETLIPVLMFISTILECIFSYSAIFDPHPGFISSGGVGSSVTDHHNLTSVSGKFTD